jgi:glycosyltransferase involved in cell wall biosynthesis
VPLVDSLREAGVDVEVLAPGRGFWDAGLAGDDGVMAGVRRRPWLLPLLLASMTWATWRAARNADVVHAHWLLLAPIAWLSGKPVVLTLHGSGSAGSLADLQLAERRPRLFRWLVRRARVVIGVSQPLTDAAALGGARDARCIPHSVTVPEQPTDRARSAGDPLRVLFAGRLSPEKGLDVLLEALDGVDGVELTIAGDGPQRALADSALGFVPHGELLELYERADVVAVPSRSEGFGVVALEAMASGAAVVASDVGGLSWLVSHERTGLVVPADDPAELRSAILRLRDDSALCMRLGAAAHAFARDGFSPSAARDATIAAYRHAHR